MTADEVGLVGKTISGMAFALNNGQAYWDRAGVRKASMMATKYYHFGGQRIAMRDGTGLYYLHGDHLGSASTTTDANGAKVGEMRFTPFGEVRAMPSQYQNDRRFTGHKSELTVGLVDMQARMYDPLIGKFVSADTIVPRPNDPQAFNRYSYVRNSPMSRIDPTGHADCQTGGCPKKVPPPKRLRQDLEAIPSKIASGLKTVGNAIDNTAAFLESANSAVGNAIDTAHQAGAGLLNYSFSQDASSAKFEIDAGFWRVSIEEKITGEIGGSDSKLGFQADSGGISELSNDSAVVYAQNGRVGVDVTVSQVNQTLPDGTKVNGKAYVGTRPGLGSWVTVSGFQGTRTTTQNGAKLTVSLETRREVEWRPAAMAFAPVTLYSYGSLSLPRPSPVGRPSYAQ